MRRTACYTAEQSSEALGASPRFRKPSLKEFEVSGEEKKASRTAAEWSL